MYTQKRLDKICVLHSFWEHIWNTFHCLAVRCGHMTKSSQWNRSKIDVRSCRPGHGNPLSCIHASSWLGRRQPHVEDDNIFFSMSSTWLLEGESTREHVHLLRIDVNKNYTPTVYIRGLFVIPANILLCNLLLSLKNIYRMFFHVSAYTIIFL